MASKHLIFWCSRLPTVEQGHFSCLISLLQSMDCIGKVTGLCGDVELTGITVFLGTLCMLSILNHKITKPCHLKNVQATELVMS